MKKKKKSILKTKKLSKRSAIILLSVLVLVAVFFGFRSKDSKNDSMIISKGTVVEELILSGSVNADEYASLSYPVSGKVSWVGVQEGDLVKKGQTLGKLDTTSLNAALQQAKATLRAAEATVANVYDQVKDHSTDETYAQRDTRTTAEVVKDRAYEAYIAAQDNLRNATIYSPFSGIVTYVAVPYAGVSTIFSQKQFEVINPETIYFEATADQTEIIDIKVGQQVVITMDAFDDEELSGEVVFVSYAPKSGEAGIVYKIKIKFLSENISVLKVGMTGDVKFVLNEKKDVLFLPSKYINSDNNGKYVKRGSTKDKTYVEIGLEGEDGTEIISDKINEGDLIYD